MISSKLVAAAGLLAGVFCLSVGPARAQQVRPRSEAAATAAGVLDEPRLEHPVTLRLSASLAEVLSEVGKQSGASIHAQPAVAEEPVILAVREQPAREVLRQLAALFNLKWTRGGAAPAYRYDLVKPAEAAQAEEALRQADRGQVLKLLQEQLRECAALSRKPREELVSELRAYDAAMRRFEGLPQAERAAAYSGQEYRSLVARTEWARKARQSADSLGGPLFRIGAQITPAEWTRLSHGEVVRFSTFADPTGRVLSASLAEELKNARPSSLPPGFAPAAALEAEEAQQRSRDRQLQKDWAASRYFRVRASLDLSDAAGSTSGRLSFMATALSEEGFELAAPPGLTLAANAQPAPASPPKVLPPALRISKVFTFENKKPAGSGWLNDALLELADAYGVNLVSDGYRAQRMARAPASSTQETALAAALTRYVSPNAAWTADGSFVRIRRYGWYLESRAHIPQREADRWLTRLKSARQLTLDETVTLVRALRDEQLAAFPAVAKDEGLRLDTHLDLPRARPLLLAYGALSAAQRQFLLRGGKVSYRDMSGDVRRYLGHAVDRWRREQYAEPDLAQSEEGNLALTLAATRPSGPTGAAGETLPPVIEARFTYRFGSERSFAVNIFLPRVTAGPGE